MIKLQNVFKSLGGTPVLKDFSFDLSSGHSLALLGLSGSGKTTALKLIAGLHLPDQGTITAGNVTVTKDSLHLVRAKIGYVIQDGGLFPHLTARKNIALVGEEAGLSSVEISKRITELSRMTKLGEEFLDRFPRELSGGQRQRVGIMRALLLDPEILLLDEPMGALDPITRNELQNELKDLIDRLKKTVVLVTHDLFEAKFLAERIILLNEGAIVQVGRLEELIEKPANEFVRKFVEAQKNHMGEA